ncbi:Asp23/Gls24 family envelope stress response protein [Patulibacter minatonensis]|uniref:Asp23/Gls24 family envelope stress response protein n=1 Tax=Patulibacter minatonensis TaxID=298163 RepID=UPI000479740E|nr:Asp23/Gls24 family envelope stress response protein [Patulibacter minatonensis]
MAETKTRTTTASEGGTSTSTDLTSAGPLVTDTGNTTIADGVVSKVAGLATREVPGIHDLGGGAARVVGSVQQRVGLGDQLAQGVSVEVGTREAAVDLKVVIEYGESIPQVTEAVRRNVVSRITGITGLTVTEVNINVTDLHFAGDDNDEGARVQ